MPDQQDQQQRDRERVLELVLLGVVVVAVAVLGAPAVADAVRSGDVELATLFYPVLLAAFVGLALSRRAGE